MVSDDLLSLVGEEGTSSEGIVVYERENDGGNGEVSDCDVVSSDKLLAVGELLFKVSAERFEGRNVGGLGLLSEVLLHLVWVKFWHVVIAIVDQVVGVVGLVEIGGVVAVLLAEHAEDGA